MTRSILALFAALLFLGCFTQKKELVSDGHYTGDANEFAFLDPYLKGKRIVAIGESSHGIGDFYALKAKLVEHLYRNLGFEVIAMEGGFGDINLAWLDVDQLSAKALRNQSLYGNFRCAEIEPLFQLLKKQSTTASPLRYTGFDCQISGSYFTEQLDTILSLGTEELRTQLAEGFAAYYKIYPAVYEEDSTNFVTHRDQFLHAITAVREFVAVNRSRIQQENQYIDLEMKIIEKSLAGLWQSMDIPYSKRFNAENLFTGIVLRDKIMFENFQWIMEELYPNKKVIIWGHNGHIQKGGIANMQTKFMGQLLKEAYGAEYYALGLFAYQGKSYQHWTQETVPFENADTSFLEQWLVGAGKQQLTFQHLSGQANPQATPWMFQSVNALEMENGGTVRFVPAERFDGVLCLYEVDIPTFND